jgi:nicotinate-nucleotide--dimethylbenzimidazole phosphoribosyltransferase
MSDAPPDSQSPAGPVERFSEEARRAVYDVIALRRDIRHFRVGEEIDEETLVHILEAAHLAPSVGFSQPWRFIVIRDRERRMRIRENFLRCREAESVRFPPERRRQYLSYRLEGIAEATLNICVVVDLRSRGEAILGTTAQPEAVRASACCAVENLWLAARAEGIGVGWVSIVEPAVLRDELGLPPGVEPIAYLCIGRPVAFRARPMLEETGWLARLPLPEAIFRERWDARDHPPQKRSSSVPVPSPRVIALDDRALTAARAHQDELTKPKGSLGRLEDLAAWYAGAIGQFPCEPPQRPMVAVFAADHGVVAEGVSAYSSQVTAAMVCNMMAGGAAINVLARRHQVDLALVDVGVAGDLSAAPTRPIVALRAAKVRAGTANLYLEPAMEREEAEEAVAVGARTADACIDGGADILGTGEIGIGNTTAAAAVVCAMLGAAACDVVGSGTGIDDVARARKIAVVEGALRRHAPDAKDPLSVLAAVGGLEFGAIVGFILRAVERRTPVVLDGFLSGASALVARGMCRDVTHLMVASHASTERGSGLVLDALGLRPLLSLEMRLGEGTGAVLGIDLVRSAVALQHEMATFATAGVPRTRQ